MRYTPGLRAARSLRTSLAHGPLSEARHAHGPGYVIPGTRSASPANTTRGAQHVRPRTRAHMGQYSCQIYSIPQFASILAIHALVLYPARIVSTPASHHAIVRAWAVHKHGTGLARSVPRSRRGSRNNAILYTTHDSRLGQSVSHFLTCTHISLVICTTHMF